MVISLLVHTGFGSRNGAKRQNNRARRAILILRQCWQSAWVKAKQRTSNMVDALQVGWK